MSAKQFLTLNNSLLPLHLPICIVTCLLRWLRVRHGLSTAGSHVQGFDWETKMSANAKSRGKVYTVTLKFGVLLGCPLLPIGHCNSTGYGIAEGSFHVGGNAVCR